MYQITALKDSTGPTIEGLTEMQSGRSYVVRDEDVDFYRRHPDAFTVGAQVSALAAYGMDATGNVTGLVGPGGVVLMQFIDVGGDASGVSVEV